MSNITNVDDNECDWMIPSLKSTTFRKQVIILGNLKIDYNKCDLIFYK